MNRFRASDALKLLQQGFTLAELECFYKLPASLIRFEVCEYLGRWISENYFVKEIV